MSDQEIKNEAQEEVKTEPSTVKKHSFWDHGIICYFILLFYTYMAVAFGAAFDSFIARFLPGYGKEAEAMSITATEFMENLSKYLLMAATEDILITQYEKVLGELNPNVANDNAVKELRGQVENMQSQMQEMLSLLKQRTINPTV